ncbi:MAG: leucine-rich repeat domain-containing protein, partial [Bacilli bacterium]|nr:leucine-rich repeat domain-containing protein [Bacilli bacterium]
METINKRLSYLLTSFLPVAMLFAIIGFRQNDAVNGIKADSSYSITLNASNAPQTLTSEPTSSSFVGPKGVSFSYSLASTMASGFMNLAEYGTIENTDQITTIIGYRIVFSGNIRLSFGWSQGETLIYFTQGENLQSGVTHTIEGDYYYFSIYSMSGSSEITSITINYSCVPTPAAATYTLSSDGNSYIVTGYSKYPTNLVIPSTYNDLPVTEIAPYVFSSLYYLQSVYIPDSVIKIGTAAFYDCDNLETVRLPDGLLELPSSVFDDCGKLTTIALPETLQIIGDYAFASSAITEINIPNSVTTLGTGCFYFTENLTTFTFDTPVSVNHIASNMFEASGLISITLPEGIESIGVNGFSNSSLETIGFPSTLTTIDDYAFYASSSFETMTGILENVTYIGSEAFEGTLWSDANLDADNLVVFDERIIVNGRDASGALTITEGIEAIASYAFLQNASLSEIIMPSSLLHIHKGAFAENSALVEVDFSLSTNLLTIGEEA